VLPGVRGVFEKIFEDREITVVAIERSLAFFLEILKGEQLAELSLRLRLY